MNNKAFFMVYVENERNPAFKHLTLDSAEKEAKRLSKNTGKKAYVLCTIKSIEIIEFKETDMRPPNDDLPF